MLAEFGHVALILALLVALIQSVVPMIGAGKGWRDWMDVGRPASQLQFLLVAVAFAALTHAFVTSDFSVRLVVLNSHSLKPMLYKVTGVWGNHEGSLLLWVLILTGFGAAVGIFGGGLPERLRARVLAVQGMLGAAFLAFLLFTSNPFLRLANPPFDGNDLNPLLQDPGLAFHPPFLYLGYVGLSMAFSFAVAALIEGRVDGAWARWVRPWTLAAWVFLTIGIAMGSWWAYYELGWGGFWFWDPVENASFMPWLVAAALLHSAIVTEKREALKSWTVLLAILAFSFSLIGTFITRSGVITSVHAFASDPARGVFILGILAVSIGGALTLYAWRAGQMKAGAMFATASRESALVLNNLLLVVSAFVIFIGTVWPLIIDFTSGGERKVSVGAPFFDTAFTPFMIVLAMLLPLGSLLPWKRAKLGRAARPLLGAAVLSLALGALAWSVSTGGGMLAPVGTALGAWLVLGAMAELAERSKLGKTGGAEVLRRLGNLPRADWGKAIAHAGFGVTLLGVALITAWEEEDIGVMRPGDEAALGAYTLRMEGVERVSGPNYRADMGRFSLLDGDRVIAQLYPEKRYYPVAQMPTTEAAIRRSIWNDYYIAIGEPQEGGGWAVRSYVKPFANWIWTGSILMALGGFVSLSDRRLRVAAPARRAPQTVPAE